jgi:hypothetical protein
MNNLSDLPLTKVLIHGSYGAYGLFSKEFREEFEKTYNISFGTIIHYDPSYDVGHRNKYIESRYDKRLIDICEKLGSEKSLQQNERTYYNSLLTIELVPTEIIDALYISEYDGSEWLWFNTSKKYKELLMMLLDNKIDISEVNEKIKVLKKCEQYLLDNKIDFV